MNKSLNMYQVFLNNEKYVKFINIIYYKKAVPNETVLKVLYNNKVYASYLLHNNNKLNQQDTLKTLNMFKDKFWLKQKAFAVTTLLKYVKNNEFNVNDVGMIFTDTDLNNAITQFLNNLFLKTKLRQKTIIKIYNVAKLNNIEALNLILKKKLVR